ncbi:hypothetical protein AAKU61_002564 [Undibacterium sp. GrIS 1.2]|uniref:phosphoribosyltransferase-like protein n=1 Tax=Undibacterium sp. GrIS 1.2 TaxID=3143933 RepID=UPI0033922D46
MSIVAEKISADLLYDMIELFDAQPWVKHQHEEIAALWNICETREQQELLKLLIKKFVIFDAAKERDACAAIEGKFQQWGLVPQSTWVVALANAREPDGSQVVLQRLKNKIEPIDKWHSRFISNIPNAVEKISKNQSVVLLDDFIGSGQKFIKHMNWLKRLLTDEIAESTKFYCVSYSGMQFGIDSLSATTGCEIFSFLPMKKAISEEFDSDTSEKYRQIMIAIESKLAPKYKNKSLTDFTLGFNSSESLYCAESDNCPNNVFPVFWWAKLVDNVPFRTLLKRAG